MLFKSRIVVDFEDEKGSYKTLCQEQKVTGALFAGKSIIMALSWFPF